MTNETKIIEMIEDLALSMVKGFDEQEKKTDKKIENLAVLMAKGFATQDERFEKIDSRLCRLENDNVWIKNTLENHSTVLDRLDQERVFTINHVNRLEDEINKIKKQLKIA